MPAPNPLSIFAPGLNKTGLRWMAVGSIASNAYGEFRVTNDVDVILVVLRGDSVIIGKLEFLREGGGEKHLRDIRGILAVTDVDLAFLENAITRRGLSEPWQLVRT